jgi:hypothetical protein
VGGGSIYKVLRVINEEGRSTEYPEGTVLANINRLVALTYFPQKPLLVYGDIGSRPPNPTQKL